MKRCPICDGSSFAPALYNTRDLRAPALECRACHAIVLDEDAASSDEERASVRMAIERRAKRSSAA